MSVERIVRAEFAQVVREQHRDLGVFDDDLEAAGIGAGPCCCFAIIVARLEDQLGTDPFTASEDVYFPVTLGDFIKFYHNAAA